MAARPPSIDPFLWAHGLRGHIFDIATGLRPASVRDQITRARLLIRRAWERRIIDSLKGPIVICGGGIAGVVCALEAKKYDVAVVLVEKERFPFLLQRRCVTRKVDPNLYDWPAPNWHSMVYPSQRGDHIDLKFSAAETPREVAQRWTTYLARQVNSRFTIRYGRKVVHVTPDLDAKSEHTVTLDSGETIHASMVIIAEGPGQERDTMPPDAPYYRGYRFWDTDPFNRDPITARHVLITGSGDGALQDFIRLILKPDISIRRFLSQCDIPDDLLATIHACRQHNVAAFLWCADLRHEHDNDLFIHGRHLEIIDALFTSSHRLRKRILRTVERSMRQDLPDIRLAHACKHFTHGYPLNRFVALLLARALRELKQTAVRLQPSTFVTAITCVHDPITDVPTDERRLRLRRRKHCYGKQHEVSFATGRCFDAPPQPSPNDVIEEFDAIILRLGVREELLQLELHRGAEKPLRQLLPTHLAHQP